MINRKIKLEVQYMSKKIIKPSILLKMVSGAPIQADLNTNVWLKNILGFGASYRTGESVLGMAEVQVTPQLRVGYAYDYTLSNLGRFNSGSHEIMILFDISKNKDDKDDSTGYDKSPRFF